MEIITSKFQTTLPHTKSQDAHSHIHREKVTLSEIRNHYNTHTHTHTHTHTTIKHIKYRRAFGVKEAKVNTP